MLEYNSNYPNFIKYMGSKSNILDFVMEGIREAYIPGQYIVDLFSGSATLSGALRGHSKIISNDIQVYSSVISEAYLSNYDWYENLEIIDNIIDRATVKYNELISANAIDREQFNYNDNITIKDFNKIEKKQQNLINIKKWQSTHYLFAKYYSGTYWSYDQCVWIDSFRAISDEYTKELKSIILSSLMFAMSYNAQSTGHYAQYRDAKTSKSMKDILIYRKKEIVPYVRRKLEEIRDSENHENVYSFKVYNLDYRECLKMIPEKSTIYADPPYCFVHYSRFYHAIETLIKYDYPEVKFKGRYRDDRHQSPFSIKTKVEKAFCDLFELTKNKNSNLVLSYSNTGMISLEEIREIAIKIMPDYHVELITTDYKHSTMGRSDEKFKDVQEAIIILKQIGN
jgi:adenine-specific DNA-methyltransferase